MKRYIPYLILLALLPMVCQQVEAQTRPTKVKVTFDQDSMDSQLLRYLNGNSKAEEKIAANTQLVESFNGVYRTLDSKHQQQVVDLYNAARKTKMEPSPDYENLTRTLVAYHGSRVSATIFDEWLTTTAAIMTMTSKKKEITGYIEYTAALLESRTLYRSKSSVWKTQPGTTFQLEALRNDIRTVFKGSVDLTYISGTGNNADQNTIYGTTGT